MRRMTLLAGFSAATLLTGMSFAHANPTGPKGEGSHDCGSGYTVTWSPTSVFPPNHKYVNGTLTYTSPKDSDNLSLNIGVITHDEIADDGTELNGTGNTPVDSTGSGTSTAKDGVHSVSLPFQIRAERAGGGDGRTYTIPFTADASAASSNVPVVGNPGDENQCSGNATVDVPHDMGGGNDS
ncbi:MAG: putative exported chitinase [Frankiales bacterium]|nr:putative exported chitinase [Frankiales bacterium]